MPYRGARWGGEEVAPEFAGAAAVLERMRAAASAP